MVPARIYNKAGSGASNIRVINCGAAVIISSENNSWPKLRKIKGNNARYNIFWCLRKGGLYGLSCSSASKDL